MNDTESIRKELSNVGEGICFMLVILIIVQMTTCSRTGHTTVYVDSKPATPKDTSP